MYNEDVSLIDIHRVRTVLRKEISFHLEPETVEMKDAVGRILAEDVFSPTDLPESPRSAMDGYAVVADQIKTVDDQSPVMLPLKGEIRLGEIFNSRLGDNTCIKIPTGGVVPPGFDTVVPVEFTKEVVGGILILRALDKGSNIDPPGTFHHAGELLISGGKVLGPNDLAVLASLGLQQINVQRKIRVAIAATGNELVAQGTDKSADKIYESNSTGIISMLEQTGLFQVTHFGILKDERAAISGTLLRMLEHNDVTITIGGTALGALDLIPEILSEMKPGILFHGMKTRPGVPTLFAISGNKPIIGLPGPPVSAFLVMYEIFRPVLLEKAGVVIPSPVIKAVLSEEVKISSDKYNIIPVQLNFGSSLTATPLGGSSAAVTRLSRADGYFTYLGDDKFLKPSTEISVVPFHL